MFKLKQKKDVRLFKLLELAQIVLLITKVAAVYYFSPAASDHNLHFIHFSDTVTKTKE